VTDGVYPAGATEEQGDENRNQKPLENAFMVPVGDEKNASVKESDERVPDNEQKSEIGKTKRNSGR
jgi:hypothetical protein